MCPSYSCPSKNRRHRWQKKNTHKLNLVRNRNPSCLICRPVIIIVSVEKKISSNRRAENLHIRFRECLADTFRYERKSSKRQLLLKDKVSNDNIRYVVKRHCLLQDIFSKKTLSVPTLAVDTVLVVRHFPFLSKKTLSVTKFSVFRHFLLSHCWL